MSERLEGRTMTEHPLPPESRLLGAARKKLGISMRKAAEWARLSPERWRQIEQGKATVARGIEIAVADVPADTIARMARAVDVTPDELDHAGRGDAATELRKILAAEPATTADALEDVRQRLDRLERHMGLEDGGDAPGKAG